MNGENSNRYREAGVDIDSGNRLVERIKPAVASTRRDGVMGDIGGFGGLFDIAGLGYRQPLLVAATDGVGTKLRLAIDSGRHEGVGIDLVAMCVNDLLVQGAEPLFFLDYYACSKLEVDAAAAVVEGISEGCRQAGCALLGGETAEMPGMYPVGDYDLAGFAVGIVERDALVDGRGISAGDMLIGVASSGVHSNGYSLVRRILEETETTADTRLGDDNIMELLLRPTRIYVRPVLEVLGKLPVHGMCHITGGGLLENLPRVLPEELAAAIDSQTWQWPAIFQWLQDAGDVGLKEMYRTFNCGVGYVLVTSPGDTDAAIDTLNAAGEHAWILGRVEERQQDQPAVRITGS